MLTLILALILIWVGSCLLSFKLINDYWQYRFGHSWFENPDTNLIQDTATHVFGPLSLFVTIIFRLNHRNEGGPRR